jgi:hypothetical protein
MPSRDDLNRIMSEVVSELLRYYDERVPERAEFPDVRVGRSVHFDDPQTTRPGRVELVVMHMDKRLDPRYERLRFVSVRVMKSREGGFASSTCLHGEKRALREQLESLVSDPAFLVERVSELADGLPEATNPDLWK